MKNTLSKINIIAIFFLLIFSACSSDISYSKIEDESITNLNDKETSTLKTIEELTEGIKIIKSNDKLLDDEDTIIMAIMPRGIYQLGFINSSRNFNFSSTWTGDFDIDAKESNSSKAHFIYLLNYDPKQYLPQNKRDKGGDKTTNEEHEQAQDNDNYEYDLTLEDIEAYETAGDKPHNRAIVFYDNNDFRGITALRHAKSLGYSNVYYILGGFKAFKERVKKEPNRYRISHDIPDCCKI